MRNRINWKKWERPVIILLILFLVGCGPSPEEQKSTAVALTATAATNTPIPTLTSTPTPIPTPTSTPTSTPTPIPYDLSVLVTDGEGLPILNAEVIVAEAEKNTNLQTTDEVGQAFWYNLPEQTVTISISAQGYYPLEETKSIERGINQFTITLERDPHGLLPSEACAPGEQLLYIEDFQDGKAPEWPEIEHRAQGWELGPHPDSPGNIVIFNHGYSDTQTGLQDYIFDNAVWRINFMPIGKPNFIFNWHFVVEPYEVGGDTINFSNYQIAFPYPSIRIVRGADPLPEVVLLDRSIRIETGVWHTIEISTYQGLLEVWLDGNRVLAYTDPAPLPGGPLGIELWQSEDDQSIIYFDNISVCELTAPFVPMPTQEP